MPTPHPRGYGPGRFTYSCGTHLHIIFINIIIGFIPFPALHTIFRFIAHLGSLLSLVTPEILSTYRLHFRVLNLLK